MSPICDGNNNGNNNNSLKLNIIDHTNNNLIKSRIHTGEINYNWTGTGQILDSGKSDNVILEFTGIIKVPNTKNYTFRTTSDDGVRLTINSDLIINNWTIHAATNDDDLIINWTIHGDTNNGLNLKIIDLTNNNLINSFILSVLYV